MLLLFLLRIAFLTRAHLSQRLPLVHAIAMPVIPENLDGMITHLFYIFDLKMLGGVDKKERAIVGVHIPMPAPAGYARAIFP